MNYRKFSDLGWNVSEIGLGCWQLGWGWGEVISNDNAKEIPLNKSWIDSICKLILNNNGQNDFLSYKLPYHWKNCF